MWREISVSNGNIVELKVNGAMVCSLNTEGAKSNDYLEFLGRTVSALIHDKTLITVSASDLEEIESRTFRESLNVFQDQK